MDQNKAAKAEAKRRVFGSVRPRVEVEFFRSRRYPPVPSEKTVTNPISFLLEYEKPVEKRELLAGGGHARGQLRIVS